VTYARNELRLLRSAVSGIIGAGYRCDMVGGVWGDAGRWRAPLIMLLNYWNPQKSKILTME